MNVNQTALLILEFQALSLELDLILAMPEGKERSKRVEAARLRRNELNQKLEDLKKEIVQ